MRAYRLLADGPELVGDLPTPEPREGEALVRIAGAGACHSDLHVVDAVASGTSWFDPPFTLGHENAGWVEALGPGARGFAVGDPVAIYCAWGCGRCRACVAQSDNYCEEAALLHGAGLGRDGGMAEFMLVPSTKYLVALGSVDPRIAAPLTDAGLTPYHAVKRSLAKLPPGANAVVIGVGGLGHMAIQILRALTAARIIAVDLEPTKLELARTLGADDMIASNEHALSDIVERLGGRRADVVFDFVGAQSTIDLGRKLVRPDGDFAIVGLGGGTMPFGQGKIAWGARVSTPFYGSIGELREVIALAGRGRLNAAITHFPLERAGEAYAAMRAGTLEGRAVILPGA